ncbi:MAG: hypothetical protein JWP44_2710 [Mucilaginibacter sp.]|nr:hypothetical protein [Mucilaginibacter sp.]
MTEMKTKPTEVSVETFLEKTDNKTREDCNKLIDLMERITGEKPKMWGPSIIGFGQYHYKYASGHQGDICLTGFSPRKGNLSLYLLAGFEGQADLLSRLGKHKAGKGCLYIKKLEDVDMVVLENLVVKSIDSIQKKIAEGKEATKK